MRCLREGLCDYSPGGLLWHVPLAIAVTTNTAEFGTLYTEISPTLLTASELFCLVRNRRIHLRERWLAMGFLHPDVQHLVMGDDNVRPGCFPAVDLITDGPGKLKGSSQRRITGNGMHVAAAASWIAYTLAGWSNEGHE